MTAAAGLRQAARAFVAITVGALAADAVLAAAGRLLDVVGRDVRPPWWVAANLVPRGRWVAFALILAAATGRGPRDGHGDPAGAGRVWRWAGMAALLVPVAWIAATWMVQAILFTAAHRWDVDGLVFTSPDYYRGLVADYVPWLLGGAVAIALSRHVR